MCKRKISQVDAVNESLAEVTLHPSRLTPLRTRYQTILLMYSTRTHRYSFSFHMLRLFMTIGSLIVPALLSVQNNGTASQEVYWVVWVLSLLVTMSNGIMTLLKVDKKYFLLNTVLQQLLSEGWQYIHLSGKYSGQRTPGHAPTHENQYPFFAHAIEKIRMKHVEEEYYKVTDVSSQQHQQLESLVPPTPLRNPLLQVNDGLATATTVRRQPPFTQAQNSQTQGQGLPSIEEIEEGSSRNELA